MRQYSFNSSSCAQKTGMALNFNTPMVWMASVPRKVPVFKAWSPACGAPERWLDHEVSDLVSELIMSRGHNVRTLARDGPG